MVSKRPNLCVEILQDMNETEGFWEVIVIDDDDDEMEEVN